MNTSRKMAIWKAAYQSGFSMVEILVSLIILLVGLLGLAGLMVQSQRSEMESYQRVQALILLQDMAGRVNANRNIASCYAITTSFASGSPNLGASPTLPGILPLTCGSGTATQNAQYTADMTAWHNSLLGAAESGSGAVGAMIGARGCISYSGATADLIKDKNGTDIAGTGIYTIAVAWQGLGATYAPAPVDAPAMRCGFNQYGAETQRRIVSLTFRIGAINNII